MITPPRTLRQLAQEALDVQNACNLCGVAQSFARAMIDLHGHCPAGTDERNTHPITIAWLDKMNSLAGIQSWSQSDDTIGAAFAVVEAMAAVQS